MAEAVKYGKIMCICYENRKKVLQNTGLCDILYTVSKEEVWMKSGATRSLFLEYNKRYNSYGKDK